MGQLFPNLQIAFGNNFFQGPSLQLTKYIFVLFQDEPASKREPLRSEDRARRLYGCIIGVFWATFCKIGCFTLGATAINSLSWSHTFSGRTWCMASKNGSKNNDTPRVIIVYNTINNGTKYPGGYFEPAIKQRLRRCHDFTRFLFLHLQLRIMKTDGLV